MYYELIKALDNSCLPKKLSDIPIEVSFMAGRWISEKLDSPLKFEIEKTSDNTLPDFMNSGGMLLFSSRLVEKLNSAGIDNLQLFAAEIHVKEPNLLITNYFVANILGVIQCVSLSRSEYTEIMPGLYEFSKISINLDAIKMEKLFRIAESNRRILIHESVIQYVISSPLNPELFGFDVREIDQA